MSISILLSLVVSYLDLMIDRQQKHDENLQKFHRGDFFPGPVLETDGITASQNVACNQV